MLQTPFYWMMPQKKNSKQTFVINDDLEFGDQDKFASIKRAVGTIRVKEVEYASLVEEIAD